MSPGKHVSHGCGQGACAKYSSARKCRAQKTGLTFVGGLGSAGAGDRLRGFVGMRK